MFISHNMIVLSSEPPINNPQNLQLFTIQKTNNTLGEVFSNDIMGSTLSHFSKIVGALELSKDKKFISRDFNDLKQENRMIKTEICSK